MDDWPHSVTMAASGCSVTRVATVSKTLRSCSGTKPTISVPVGIAWSTDGLYVSSHGKVSQLRDTDGDGKADTEEIIASGWPPTDVGSGGVDATAVTLDKEGNVYFGLLVADYSNAYRLRKRKGFETG